MRCGSSALRFDCAEVNRRDVASRLDDVAPRLDAEANDLASG
jgi:hypothetical protein